MSIVTTLLALLIEAAVGYPESLFRRIGHPVVWIGRLIGWCDRTLNREDWSGAHRKVAGFVSLFVFVGIPTTLAVALEHALGLLPLGVVLVAVLASTLIAQRSLYQHVARVAEALEHEGLTGGRQAVSQIVGRDPEALDEAGVCRAAIESLAENFSDGVVAPTVWMAAGGLAGAVAYKAVNTGDSMIGHRNARHINFGYATARLDDLVNLPASRLSALLICGAAALTGGAAAASAAWEAVWRDAPHHRSPNAGYPEAAMAGALGLSLAGPRAYGGVTVDDAFMGNGRRDARPEDIRAALRLYKIADGLLIALIAVLALTALS
jgi:adenosylcobinamide-phosphate synthase